MVFYETNGKTLNAENGLYLSQNTEGVLMGGAQFLRNKNYLLITPTSGGAAAQYTYAATSSMLHIEAADGTMDITFARDGGMRVRTKNLGIRITAKMGFGDVAMMHGTAAQAEMDGAVYFMAPLKGSVTADSHYDLLTYRYTDPIINFETEDGVLEVVVYDRSFADGKCPEIKGSFEDCVREMKEDLAEFAEHVAAVPGGLEQLLYGLWIAEKPFPGTEGIYPSNVITDVYPKAKEQPVLSLVFADTGKAAELITNFEPYITKQGLVPEYVNKTKKMYQTVIADYGYAALELLKKGDLARDKMVCIYDMLATVNEWWTKNRSRDGVIFYYAYRFECGFAKSSVIRGDSPVVTPDLMTRMVLLAEALAAYADKIGAESAVDQWKDLAERRRAYLLEELWQDGRFVCRNIDGTVFESESLLCWMPVLLGEKLPEEIAGASAKNVIEKFLEEGKGLRLEADGGVIDTVTMSLVIAGLCDAGQKEAAGKIVDAMRDFISENGLYLSYPAKEAPVKRCGSLYQPVSCAAAMFAVSKTQ